MVMILRKVLHRDETAPRKVSLECRPVVVLSTDGTVCQCCVLAGRRLTRERRRTREGRRGLRVRHLSLGKIVMRVERLEAFANLLEQLFPDAGLQAEGRRQTLGWRWALGLSGEASLLDEVIFVSVLPRRLILSDVGLFILLPLELMVGHQCTSSRANNICH